MSFPEMLKKRELLPEGTSGEMLNNHTTFREMLTAIEEELNNSSYDAAAAMTDEYANALLDHIAVENEEVFQAAYSVLNDIELENIYYRFADLDRDLGETKKNDLVEFMKLLKGEFHILS